MHCPKCGQQQVSDEIRYCSRCGFLLTGVAEVVGNNGVLPGGSGAKTGISKRTRGLKQAAFIFILGLVLVPIWIAFLVGTNGPPELAVAAVFIFLGTAILRAAYALLFQSNDAADRQQTSVPHAIQGIDAHALPPQTAVSVDDYAAPSTGGWRETHEFVERPSVTETTTKLLSKQEGR